MDTLTKSCSPTIVITANGEVQTHEEAIVYVKELDIFLTMKVLENTPAVLSLGKLCDENGYSYEWINGQKPHLIKDGICWCLQYTQPLTSHSPPVSSMLTPQQQQQQRAGALTLSSSCLDGSVTPVGPGQNPQYTGAPKEGGGCGLLDKSTTTSPMAQPQCSKKQCINVNMVAEQFRSTAL